MAVLPCVELSDEIAGALTPCLCRDYLLDSSITVSDGTPVRTWSATRTLASPSGAGPGLRWLWASSRKSCPPQRSVWGARLRAGFVHYVSKGALQASSSPERVCSLYFPPSFPSRASLPSLLTGLCVSAGILITRMTQ